jgi:polyhydroxybutyrate depolymerase
MTARKLLLLVTATVAALSGTAQQEGSFFLDGDERTYLVYIPTTYAQGQSLPLVFVLHGAGGNAQDMVQTTNFNDLAETHSFIAVYGKSGGFGWNTDNGSPDDYGYIDTLVDIMYAAYGIDTNRVYSCGFSSGGYMSHAVGCRTTRCFAAVASVAGTMYQGWANSCTPTFSMPVLHIHGTQDLIVDYGGNFLSGLGAVEVVQEWVGHNNCPTPPQVTELSDLDPNDGCTVQRRIYAPCDGGAQVVLLRVQGGAHTWPGTSVPGIGNTAQDIDASQEIWNFFDQFSCAPTATATGESGSVGKLPKALLRPADPLSTWVRWHPVTTCSGHQGMQNLPCA